MRIVRLLLAGLLMTLGVGALATAAAAYPVGQAGTAQINATIFAPAATVVVTVEHTTPGPLSMAILSAPVTIGTGTTGPDGQGSVTGTIPAGYSGSHTIEVTGAGGEIYSFAITVTGRGTGGCNPVIDPPDGRAVDAHTVVFSISRCIGVGQTATATLTSSGSDWRAQASVATDAGGYASFRNVTVTDPRHSLPVGTSTIFVSVTAPNGGNGGGGFDITVAGATGTPPTTTPTIPPTGTSSGATATGSAVGGGPGGGGTLASTGAQVALGSGVGLVALLAGAVLLLAGRRRSAPRHGG